MFDFEPSPAAISSSATARDKYSMPAPSQRSGTTMPSAPSPPSAFNASRGNACSRSHCAALGASSSRAKVRNVSRKSCCSSLSSIESGLLFPRKTQAKTPEHASKRSLRPASPSRSRGEETPHVCGREHEQRIAGDRESKLSCRQNEALRQHAAVRG